MIIGRSFIDFSFCGNVRPFNVSFSPDSQTISCACADGTVLLCSVTEHKRVVRLCGRAEDCATQRIAYSRDSQLLASSNEDCSVHLFSLAKPETFAVSDWHGKRIWSGPFLPDYLLCASLSDDGIVRKWILTEKKEIAVLRGHSDYVLGVSFSPDGRLLASASCDMTVCLWSVPERKMIANFCGHIDWVKSVVFSPDGQLLASASYDSTVRLWRVSDRKEIAVFRGRGRFFHSIAFSFDGKLLAAGSDIVQLWSVRDCKEIAIFYNQNNIVVGLSFSPDGQFLAIASGVGKLHVYLLWNLVQSELQNIAIPLLHYLPPYTLLHVANAILQQKGHEFVDVDAKKVEWMATLRKRLNLK